MEKRERHIVTFTDFLSDLGKYLGILGYVTVPPISVGEGVLNHVGIVAPLYGISLFLPTIIKELGYTKSTAQLLTVPIYVTASILAIAVAWWSDKKGKRYPFILTCLCIMAVGFIMCIATSNPGVIYAGVFIAACALYPAFPGNITWLSNSKSSNARETKLFRTDPVRPCRINEESCRSSYSDSHG